MKDRISKYLADLKYDTPWKEIAIIGIKVLVYGLLAIVTAIEEKK